jgi:hypothetical protein
MEAMTTLKEQIIEALIKRPGLTDRELTDRIKGRGAPQQPVNIACRELTASGVLRRTKERPDGLIGNFPTGAATTAPRPASPANVTDASTQTTDSLSEDDVKRLLKDWLEARRWAVEIAWGHVRGVDLLASKGSQRWVVEAKGCGSRQPMRVNYFLAILGETLQRMDDEATRYSIALPDMAQFRGLWDRLPKLAKQRTGISALFVAHDGRVTEC